MPDFTNVDAALEWIRDAIEHVITDEEDDEEERREEAAREGRDYVAQVKTSSLARRLWRLLTELPGEYTIETFAQRTGAGKMAVRAMLEEMADAGLIRMEVE